MFDEKAVFCICNYLGSFKPLACYMGWEPLLENNDWVKKCTKVNLIFKIVFILAIFYFQLILQHPLLTVLLTLKVYLLNFLSYYWTNSYSYFIFYLQEVAVKLESTKARHPQLLYESKLYKILQGGVGIPHVRLVYISFAKCSKNQAQGLF